MSVPLLEPDKSRDAVTLSFDEATVPAQAGETVSMSLIADDVLMTSRSAKYRRPRGAYCLSGDCGTCLVRIDGRPNMKACVTTVAPQMRLGSQNTYRPRQLDPTGLFDYAFPSGMDHHHFMVKPRLVNNLMQGFARNLTGFGEIPSEQPPRPAQMRVQSPTVLVIGGGSAGRAAARVLDAAGIDHLVAERHEPEGIAVFGFYPEEDAWAGTSGPSGSQARECMHILRPVHTLLCLGAREPMLPLPNNDLPGVVAARGLLRQLRASGRKLAVPVVVVGEGAHAEEMASALADASLRTKATPAPRFVPIEQVTMIRGRSRVDAVVTRSETIRARLVALAPLPAPAHELAAQIGAELQWDGAGFAVLRDDTGRVLGVRGARRDRVWAAGDLCGYVGSRAAGLDGARVATSIVEHIETGKTA